MIIPRAVLEDVLAHAREEHPRECCGLLVGLDDRITDAIRAKNLADRADRYLIDPADHIKARRTAREQGREIVGFYHSHPTGAIYPSRTDIAEAAYPDAVYLIVSGAGEARVFRLIERDVREIALTVEP